MKGTFKQFEALEKHNAEQAHLLKKRVKNNADAMENFQTNENKLKNQSTKQDKNFNQSKLKGKQQSNPPHEEEEEEFEESDNVDDQIEEEEAIGDDEENSEINGEGSEDMEEEEIEEDMEEGEDMESVDEDAEGEEEIPHPYSTMQLDNTEEPEYDILDSEAPQNVGKSKESEPDLAIVYMKIQEILHVLAKFSERRNPNVARKEYLEQLRENLCKYFGYNKELCTLFLKTFNPHECLSLMEAFETPRPVTIRTNTLKTKKRDLAQALIQRGVQLEPLAEWSKVGLKITESKVPIGATPEYLSGQYMLQSASSFVPVLALAPQPGDRVLDMAAAPGGKTTYIAQLMQNKGVIVANDYKKERLKSLFFNLQRLGVTNAIVTNYDGRIFSKAMKNFDRVLLDAPCSGIGVISRDPAIKSQKLMIDIYKSSHLQKELIRSAIDCLKVGGFLVYSTCSISVEENEEVVDYAVKKRFVKIVDTGLEIGEPGVPKYIDKQFDPKMHLCRRLYPHVHNLDGFFVAKLRKIKDGERGEDEIQEEKKHDNNKNTAKSNNIKNKKKNGKGEKEDGHEKGETQEEAAKPKGKSNANKGNMKKDSKKTDSIMKNLKGADKKKNSNPEKEIETPNHSKDNQNSIDSKKPKKHEENKEKKKKQTNEASSKDNVPSEKEDLINKGEKKKINKIEKAQKIEVEDKEPVKAMQSTKEKDVSKKHVKAHKEQKNENETHLIEKKIKSKDKAAKKDEDHSHHKKKSKSH